MNLPELLAPAGNWECARAAVENGADAIYFGLTHFNARMRADNFTREDLPALMDYLHRREVKGYLTLNTLAFTDEIPELIDLVTYATKSRVDAAIVQDVGLCSIIRSISPDFPIHASTQMTITSAEGVQFARALGCNVAVLARECSIKEISHVHQTLKMDPTYSGSPRLEVFVHGALCVAYSGQCLTSESLGGRSANRGVCAQACRMPYSLMVDGKEWDLGDKHYLLSPQDLMGLPVLKELVEAGVSSLKIEGRLKSPEYVASITRIYRQALDKLLPTFPKQRTQLQQPTSAASNVRYELEMAFSRGLYTGWLEGIDNQKLVHGLYAKKRGVFLGRVHQVQGPDIIANLTGSLKAGDGVVFASKTSPDDEEGGKIFTIVSSNGLHRLKFRVGVIDTNRIRSGDEIWKTSDPTLENELKNTFHKEIPQFKRAVRISLLGRENEPLKLELMDSSGNKVNLSSEFPLTKASQKPLTQEFLMSQLGRMGNTPFFLENLSTDIPPDVILPVSELNRMRREACNMLDEARQNAIRWTLNAQQLSSPTWSADPPKRFSSSSIITKPTLIPLVRNLSQLETVVNLNYRLVYCELENPKLYRDAIAIHRSRCSTDGADSQEELSGIFIAPPRIYKIGEDWILKMMHDSQPDGLLLRNFNHLTYFKARRGVLDFSFNVSNHWSANYFQDHYQLERITASYDLDPQQLINLANQFDPSLLEVTIHQHMPMFHMEHCVFCAFLSSGKDYTNCGRPCEKHIVELKDRVGAIHRLKADAGCRNTLYNQRAQTGAEDLLRFLDAGVRWFRIEFVDESPSTVELTLRTYENLLCGQKPSTDAWKDLKLIHQLGVTRGPREHQSTKPKWTKLNEIL